MTDNNTGKDREGKPPILDYELNHGELKDWEVRFYKRFGEGINYNAHPSVRVREFISDILAQDHTTLLERIEKMKKRELRSPRSIGDNESTVDVSPGYNQGIDDVIALLKEKLIKKE